MKNNIEKIVEEAEKQCKDVFDKISETVLFNQKKVLNAFRENRVALSHFASSSGYGYEDLGKHKLGEVFASALNCESAIVSPLIVSGTHALVIGLMGILRPGQLMLSITGDPYDSLNKAINGKNIGSLTEYGIRFEKVDFKNGELDEESIINAVKTKEPDLIFLQRSCGYTLREGITISKISSIINKIRELNKNSIIFIDNCYGTFLEKKEPCEVGADIIVDSLIKNPGGGIAPTGAYIAGKSSLIESIANRLTAPGLKTEVGSYAASYTPFFQGFFLAPSTVGAALKGSTLAGAMCDKLGLKTTPKAFEYPNDMVRKIEFNDKHKMISFIQSIQEFSPVDSFVKPIPSEMPGYDDEVIMASGSFNQGSSIELSSDAPVRPPYIAYIQGGLTYEHIKISLENAFAKIL